MPTIRNDIVGYVLHPIDLAINKLLALVGRDEPRDFLDILDLHHRNAAYRRAVLGRVGQGSGLHAALVAGDSSAPREVSRGRLCTPEAHRANRPSSVEDAVADRALSDADAFIRSRPANEAGCLYYSRNPEWFVASPLMGHDDAVPHYGRSGGVLPRGSSTNRRRAQAAAVAEALRATTSVLPLTFGR